MLRLIPLGGLGEIGLNAMVFEHGEQMLLVDAGLMFGSDVMPGVGVVVPDFSYVLAHADRLQGIVLTHGHEDHIGALSRLLRHLSVPVYGTPFTLALVRSRLEEADIEADLREIAPRFSFAVGDQFTVEPLRVSHSIPDAVGLSITTPSGVAIHSGDFKIDAAPPAGSQTDVERLGELGEAGVDLLLSDSTNAEVLEETGSEVTVARRLEELIAEAPGRVIVSMFASNIHRVRSTIDVCLRLGRRLAINGRSLDRNIELARKLGLLALPTEVVISADQAMNRPPTEVVILSTGAQAEPRSGLWQMLSDERELRIRRGDTVIFSARSIPGNEMAISRLIDALAAQGAQIIHGGIDAAVHVSGHASRPQQRRMLELVRPRTFVPIHGELKQLHAHLATARDLLPEQALLLARDGDVLEFESGRGRAVSTVPVGRVFEDGINARSVPADSLQDRRRLAEVGVVVAVLLLNRATLQPISLPALEGRGLASDEMALLPTAADACRAAVLEISVQLRADDALMKEALTRAIRRVFRSMGGKRPVVVPLVVKL